MRPVFRKRFPRSASPQNLTSCSHIVSYVKFLFLFICADDVGSRAPIVEKKMKKTLKITAL
jgi:hypothetical protein